MRQKLPPKYVADSVLKKKKKKKKLAIFEKKLKDNDGGDINRNIFSIGYFG